jgi:CRP/FNR family transcriptional regulator, cyclic AMP receptor protein
MEPRTALEHAADFAAGDQATLTRLAARMLLGDYPAGSQLFVEGDPPGPCYLIQTGQVRLTSARPDGRAQLLATLRPGMLAGEMTALLGRPRTATATTLAPTSAWQIPADALQEAFRDDPRLAYTMLLTVMELMVDQDAQAVRRMGLAPVQRLATIILEQQRSEHAQEGQPLSISPAELALLAGESQTTFTMNLARLQRTGAVETRDQHLVVTSLERLRHLAE